MDKRICKHRESCLWPSCACAEDERETDAAAQVIAIFMIAVAVSVVGLIAILLSFVK